MLGRPLFQRGRGGMSKFRLSVLIICLVFVLGCGITAESRFIPRQELSPEREKAIKQAIAANDRAALRRIGKPAAPMILERVFEIYNSKPWRQDPVWADAANLIILLSKIRDTRAVPALNYILAEVKYRVFRGDAAYALGHIGDKRAIEPLWKVFKEEKGYLAAGDRKGPDYGWGVAGNYTERMLEEIGMALERLGERPGDYPKPFHRGRF